MTTFTVRSNAELTDLLSRIDGLGGGTIKLDAAGGPYEIVARGLGSAGAPITFTAADPSAPPVVEQVDLRNSSHITVTGVEIEGREAPALHSVFVMGSDNITISDNVMTGVASEFLTTKNDALQSNSAILLRDSAQITIADNTISHFKAGIAFLEVEGLVISENDISQLQGDGIQGAGLRNAQIIDNHIHDMLGSSEQVNHDDMIQLWGVNAETVTSNVTISGNLLDSGNGAVSQGIFIRNEEFGKDGSPTSGYFQNITITDNVIHNGIYHGISVSDTNGVTIKSNTILKNEGGYLKNDDGVSVALNEPWYNVANSKNVDVTNNIGSKFIGQTTEEGNSVLVYDNTNDPMYVNNHIVNLSGQGDLDLRDLQVRTDSPLWNTAGAALTSLSGEAVSAMGPLITATKITENALARTLDIGPIELPEGTTAAWHFEDGSVVQGRTVEHVFQTPGLHEVTLIITEAGGATTTTARNIEIDDPYLFAFDFANGLADGTTRGIEAELKGTPAQAFVNTVEDKGFYLNGNTGLTLGRENIQIFGREIFNIDMRFKQTEAMESGTLLSLHTAFKLEIEDNGALSFWLRTEDGAFTATTAAGVMKTTAWQDISLQYDGVAGNLAIVINGAQVASVPATGATFGPMYWDLEFGSPWSENARGVFESVSMSLPHDAAATGTVAQAPIPVVPPLAVEAPAPVEPEAAQPPAAQAPVDDTRSLLDVDFSNGGTDASFYDAMTKDTTGGDGFTAGRDGDGFQIGGGTSFYVDHSATQIFGLDAFDIGFDLRKDDADAFGGLLNQHRILDLTLRENGVLRLRLKTEDGVIKLRTEKNMLEDTDWHRVNVIYDSEQSLVELRVDGDVAASGTLTGRTEEARSRDFIVGDPKEDSIAAVIDNLEITRPATPEEMGVMTGSASASALMAAFADMENPDDADSPFDGLASQENIFAQNGDQIDAFSDGGLTPDPLMQI